MEVTNSQRDSLPDFSGSSLQSLLQIPSQTTFCSIIKRHGSFAHENIGLSALDVSPQNVLSCKQPFFEYHSFHRHVETLALISGPLEILTTGSQNTYLHTQGLTLYKFKVAHLSWGLHPSSALGGAHGSTAPAPQ